jgi:hypothetical protein
MKKSNQQEKTSGPTVPKYILKLSFYLYKLTVQWNVLGQTVAPGYEVCPNFRNLTLSASSEYAGGFVAIKLIS